MEMGRSGSVYYQLSLYEENSRQCIIPWISQTRGSVDVQSLFEKDDEGSVYKWEREGGGGDVYTSLLTTNRAHERCSEWIKTIAERVRIQGRGGKRRLNVR